MAHYATDAERQEAEAKRQAAEDAAKAEADAAFNTEGYGFVGGATAEAAPEAAEHEHTRKHRRGE